MKFPRSIEHGGNKMDNKEVHKIVKSEFSNFFLQNGFIKQSGNEWILIKDELIQIMCLQFSYGQENFNFRIAIVPLCIPSDIINYNISASLNDFDTGSAYRCRGSYDRTQLAVDIADAKETIERNVFPWFKSMENCLDVINFLNNPISKKGFHIPPFRRAEYLSILYFYKHKLKIAKKYAKLYYSL